MSYLTTFCRYYPFYVAPFVSDLKGLSRVEISFIVDKPLRPFDQLMAVLPMRRHINCSYCCHACYLLAFSDVRVDNFNPAPLSAAGVLFQNVTIK
jgi:5'-3' exoribonuclease 2